MKSVVAAAVLFAFTANAAEPYIPMPPPLLPVAAEQPTPKLVEEPLALSKQWWWYAIWATAGAATIGGAFAFLVLVILPQSLPTAGSGTPR